LTRVFQVVEAFMNFNNTLGFFSGNEVINQDAVPQVPSYLRAVTRDMKDYITAHAPRSIPVGYSAADVRELLMGTFSYLSCDISNATDSKIDFFGLNSYSWCGDATFETSSYNVLVSDFSNTTIPVFFSEYGCNLPSPRVFTEVPVLYGPQMTPVFSGGLIYEYSEEPNNYGLVNLNDNGTVSILQDYNNLRAQYDTLDAKLLESANVTATSLQAPACSLDFIAGTGFEESYDIPARPDGVDSIIQNGVNGTFPSGTKQVTQTSPSQTVYDVDGQVLSGLTLNVLEWDQSNLPGNNTSGTSPSSSGTSSATASASSPTKTGAAVKASDVRLGSLVLGALTIGLFMHL